MGLKTLVVDSFERTRLQYSNKNRVEQILPVMYFFGRVYQMLNLLFFYERFLLKIYIDNQYIMLDAIG